MVKEQKVVDLGWMQQYITHRIEDHIKCVPCTDVDKWCRPGGSAVMEKGKKRATKIFSTEVEAKEFIDQEGFKKAKIEFRAPKYLRCESYCQARSVCPFAKSLKEV
jgi:hypothetical protein